MVFIATSRWVQKARTRRPRGSLYKKIEGMTIVMSQAAKIDLVKGIERFKLRVSTAQMKAAFNSGDYKLVMTTVPWDKLPDDLQGTFGGFGKAATAAAKQTLKSLPPATSHALHNDAQNPRIMAYIETRTGNLIQNVKDDVKGHVKREIKNTLTSAATPRDVAEAIKGSIGLNERQGIALENFRAKLAVEGVAPDRLEEMAAGYESRLLNQRAIMIARTETRNATNYGQLAVWQEAASQDLLPEDTKKVWYVDGHPCDVCAPMDGIGIPLDERWQLNNGDSVFIPSESHPNCMCGQQIDIGEGTSETSRERAATEED